MKEIDIYSINGIIAKAIVDDWDFDKINKHRWNLHACGYPITNILIEGKRTRIKMHHMIIGKPPKGKVTDHINRNRIDNRKENLRFISSKENNLNSKVRGKISYRGIVNHGCIYKARIKINGKLKYLGSGHNAKKLYEEIFVPAYIKQYGKRPPE